MAARGLWRNTNYVRYRVSRVVSLLGSRLSSIAYPLVVLHMGGGATEAGLVATAGLVTQAVCRLPGGHLADRYDRRLLMIWTDVVRFVVVAAIPVAAQLGHLAYGMLLAVAVVEGAATAAFGPAATAFIRDLVATEDLSRALGQTQGFTAATTMLGPALGGLFYGVSPTLPFSIDAASYALSAVLLVGMPIASRQQAAPGAGQPEADKRVTAGLRWLWGQPTVLRILAFAGVINLVAAATQVTVVVSLRGQGTPAGAIGAVMACCGVGTVVGALLARRIMERLDAARLCLLLGVLFAAGFASFTLSSSPWVLGPVLGVVFLLAPAAGITLATITMGEAPKHLLGRVSTAEQMVTTTLATLGPLLAGVALQTAGASSTWLGLAACCLLATVFAILPMFARREPSAAPAPSDAPAAALGPR